MASQQSTFASCDYVNVSVIDPTRKLYAGRGYRVTGSDHSDQTTTKDYSNLNDVRTDLVPEFLDPRRSRVEPGQYPKRSDAEIAHNYSVRTEQDGRQKPSEMQFDKLLPTAISVTIFRTDNETYKDVTGSKFHAKNPIRIVASDGHDSATILVDGWTNVKERVGLRWVKMKDLQPELYTDRGYELAVNEKYSSVVQNVARHSGWNPINADSV